MFRCGGRTSGKDGEKTDRHHRWPIAPVLGAIVLSHGLAANAETVVYDFGHGQNPSSGLLAANGKFYGTAGGGADDYGVVFSFDPRTGREKVLHSFDGTGDGKWPAGDLIDDKGSLYGTTGRGGGGGCYDGCGTLFSVNPKTGEFKIVHTFDGGADGAYPVGNLIDVRGTLYGATPGGGPSGDGTVFSFTPSTGEERVIHAFSGADGQAPHGGLIDVKGKLYSTTAYGGGEPCRVNDQGCGTVFWVDPSTGKEKTIHSFSGSDGANPFASLIDVRGTLYGTTKAGGGGRYCYFQQGCGSVFSVNPGTGEVTVLHAFEGERDGYGPNAVLIDVKGSLYGTTRAGNGCGTVFSVNASTGKKRNVHLFHGDADGCFPLDGLIDLRGTLYGTTQNGGRIGSKCRGGCGTLYSIKP